MLLSFQELLVFLTMMHALLRDGMRLHEALRIVSHQTLYSPLQKATQQVVVHMEKGLSAGKAFTLTAAYWPSSIIVAVVASDNTESVCDLFKHLAGVFECSMQVRSDLKKILFLPLFTAVAAFFVMGWAAQLCLVGMPHPPFFFVVCARAVTFVMQYGIESAIGILCAWYVLKKCQTFFEPIMTVVDWFVLYIPFIGFFIASSHTFFFFMLLSVLLKAGVPLPQALHSMVQLFPNRYWRSVIVRFEEALYEGNAFVRVLGAAPAVCIPASCIAVIATASSALQLAVVCEHLADTLRQERARRLQWCILFLQPFLMILVGSCIAYFLYSVSESFSLSMQSMNF